MDKWKPDEKFLEYLIWDYENGNTIGCGKVSVGFTALEWPDYVNFLRNMESETARELYQRMYDILKDDKRYKDYLLNT